MFALQRPAPLEDLLDALDQRKFTSPTDVEPLAQQALRMAEQHVDSAAQAKALCYLSWSAMLTGQVVRGVEHAAQALLLAQQNAHTREEARALGMLGAALIFAGLHDEAMVCYQRAEALAVTHHYLDALGLTLNDLGLIALRRGQNEQAVVLIERGLTLIPQEAGGGAAIGVLWMNLGVAYSQMTRLAEAEDALRRAQAIFVRTRAFTSLAWVRMELAENAARKHDYDAAQEHLAAAHDIALPLGLPNLLLMIYRQQAELANQQKNLREVLGRLALAYDLAQRHHLHSALPDILTVLSQAYAQAGDTPNSLACDQEALKLSAQKHQDEIAARLNILRALYQLRDSLDFRFISGSAASSSLDKLLEIERQRVEQQKQHELIEFRERVAHRVAHELRNPLAVIRSSGEMLQRYGLQMNEEKRQGHYHQIVQETERLHQLINDILDLLAPPNSDTTL